MVKADHRAVAAPEHLTAASCEWFESVVSQFVLEQHHVHLLTLAAEALDRADQARELIAREGLTVAGREGCKAHPAIAVEKDSRAAFGSLLKQLGLDKAGAPKRGVGRPGRQVRHHLRTVAGLPPRVGQLGQRQRRLRA